MTFIPLSLVEAADSFSIDPFNRWRVSNQKLRLSAIFDTDLRPLWWDTKLTAGGTATKIPNQPAVAMTVTVSGDAVIRQTKEYFVYRSGQGQLIFASFIFAPEEANLLQEVGYYDGDNGYIFRANGTTLEMVLRSFTSGAPVDRVFDQANWTLDKLDGSGESGIDISVTKTEIFLVDFEALYSGRIRFGFRIKGMVVYCHEINNANDLLVPYISTAKLPVRYRIEATGAIGGARTLTQICASVAREGGDSEPDVQNTQDSGNADVAVGTAWETVMGVRLKAANIRATIRAASASVLNIDAVNPLQWALVINPALASAGTFSITPPDSVAEVSRSNIVVTVDGAGDPTAGTRIAGDWAAAAQAGRGGPAETTVDETLPVVADIDAVPDELWLIARGVGAGSSLRGSVTWKEIR